MRIAILLAALSMQSWVVSADDATSEWQLLSQSGKTLSDDTLRDGTASVVVFWATWCPYCKALLPHLQSIADEYGDQLQFAAVNFRDDGDPAAYFSERGYTLDLYLDGDDLAKRYSIRGTPGLLVFDGTGNIAFNLYDYLPVARERLQEEDTERANWQKAARLTPLWAAELRRQLDKLQTR